MIGALLSQAKADALKISKSGGFQIDAILSKDGVELPVTGLATGTWMMFDDTREGKAVNSEQHSFTVHEQMLIDGNYPYKNARGRISLDKHFVLRDDGAGMTGKFVVNETHPNTTTGLIVCILGFAK